MAEEAGQPDAVRFQHEEHDVTCCLEYLCCGNTRLILGEEEAELIRNCCCSICVTKKRGPYGELGTVDSSTCCCFYGFAAASLMPEAEGQSQCTGCGCEREKVDKIVAELKKRQQMRGDRAKVRLAESTMASLNLLHKKVDLLMEKMELEVPESSEEMER